MGFFGYSCSTLLWYWCYFLHRSRDALSPVCGIFPVLHILSQELYSLYSKNGGYKLMAALSDYTRGDTSQVLSAECCILRTEC